MVLQCKPRSALVVIDLQRGLLQGPTPAYEGVRIVGRTLDLIDSARQASAPVVFVQHYGPPDSPIARGSKAWELIDALTPRPEDIRVQKMRPSIFLGTGLAEQLRADSVERLVLAGMKTQYCIDTSCRVGAELGFRIVLARDAHTTVDGSKLDAPTIIDHHNDLLHGPFAEVLPTENIIFA